MADRKVYVNVTTRLILRVDEEESVDSVLENMDYNFSPDPEQATLEDSEITDWSIEYSK